MDKSAIRNFSIEARKILMKSAETEAGFYGVTRKGCKSPIQKGNDFEVYETLAGTENRIYGADIKKRSNLVEAVETLGFDQVIEETAYTWFNRIIAIRFMEVNGYLPTRVRVLSSETGSNTPDIVTQSLDVDLNMTPEELEKVQKAKDENRYDDAFRMLFVKQCNELNAILPGLFEKTDDYMELLLKLSYTSDGVVRMLVDTVAEDNFNVETEGQVEIIGWMYQYYNTELKDDTFAKLKKNVKITKERIPAATQLFTPDWIVRYMVENSVGRVWIEHLRAIDSTIDEKAKADEFGWKYYVPEAEQETEVQKKLVEIRKSFLSLEPKDITCIDPCMGSGHILVYMFDVLMGIYKSEGFSERDAVFSILAHNIRGLDIDRRAYQLSYFALMMKARGFNRVFFRGYENIHGERKITEPIVYVIEESNSINRYHIEHFGIALEKEKKESAVEQIFELLDSFVDAKEYGSIIEIKEYDWNLLNMFCAQVEYDGQISFDTYGVEVTQQKLKNIIKLGKVMSLKYRVVSTNPPYMGNNGMNEKTSNYVKQNYPDYKSDLYSVFMKKCISYAVDYSLISMMTSYTWMYLASYEKLRNYCIENHSIVSLVRPEYHSFFEEAFVPICTFIIRKSVKNEKGYYVDLNEFAGALNQPIKLLEAVGNLNDCNYVYRLGSADFALIPGSPISVGISKELRECFKNDSIGKYALPKQGLITGNNDLFLKCWHEVDYTKLSISKGKGSYKWYPINKGGAYRRWYGNHEYIVNWEDDGLSIKSYKDEKGKLRSRPQNLEYNFKKAISWSLITTGTFSARMYSDDFTFNVAGISCFPSSEIFNYLLGFLNTKIAEKMTKVINPTMNMNVGDVANIPLILDKDKKTTIEEIVENCIALTKCDWDSFETSWNFERHPLVDCELLNSSNIYIKEQYEKWKLECNRRRKDLRAAEETLNTIFREIYDLQNEFDTTIDENELSISEAEIRREIISLISYAVGCMFGRYSLDEKGIVFAGDEWNESRYKTYVPDKDGIIPINEMNYLSDDIVNHFEEFIKCVYGEEALEKNLTYIAETLGNKGSSSREIIRNYFSNDFFEDHCNTYTMTGSGKRPIYWLFDSGKQNGFKCLVYMHRYNKDTLNLIRTEYLHKAEEAIENALKNADYIIQTSSSAVEKAKATKDRDKYVKQLNEMRIYYQALSHLAIQKIEIDLDNGVKNNYQLFQGIEVIVDGGKKQNVDLLAKI